MNKKILKNLVNTDQWKELKEIFMIKSNELTSLDNIPLNLTDKQTALLVKSNKKASQIIKETLKELNRIGIDFNKENESFK